MAGHPIEELMKTAMEGIESMIDVNTIVGSPIAAGPDILIIPISKVSFGFAAGGSEFSRETLNEYSRKEKEEAIQYALPFGGGSGAGVSLNPIAFLVVQKDTVRLMQVDHMNCFDKLIDYIPDVLNKLECFMKKDNDEDFEYEYEDDNEEYNDEEEYKVDNHNNKHNNYSSASKSHNEYINVPGDNFEVKAKVYEEEPTEEIVRNEEGNEERIQHRVKDIKVEKQIKKPIINKTGRSNEMSDSQLEDVDQDNYTRKTIRSDGEIFGDEDY